MQEISFKSASTYQTDYLKLVDAYYDVVTHQIWLADQYLASYELTDTYTQLVIEFLSQHHQLAAKLMITTKNMITVQYTPTQILNKCQALEQWYLSNLSGIKKAVIQPTNAQAQTFSMLSLNIIVHKTIQPKLTTQTFDLITGLQLMLNKQASQNF